MGILGKKFSPDSTVNDSLLVNGTAIRTGNGRAFAMNDCRQVTGFITYDSADPPTMGAVVLEHAPSATYTGAWGNLGTFDLAGIVAGTVDPAATYPGDVGFVRFRFTSDSDKDIQGYVNGILR